MCWAFGRPYSISSFCRSKGWQLIGCQPGKRLISLCYCEDGAGYWLQNSIQRSQNMQRPALIWNSASVLTAPLAVGTSDHIAPILRYLPIRFQRPALV